MATENDRLPVSILQTACNGELVPLNGSLHTQVGFTNSKSGNVAAFVSADYSLSGVGASTGAKYQGSLRIRDQEMASSNVSDFRYRTTFKLVGQGSVPNSVTGFTIHVLVSNGETRVETTDFDTRCDP